MVAFAKRYLPEPAAWLPAGVLAVALWTFFAPAPVVGVNGPSQLVGVGAGAQVVAVAERAAPGDDTRPVQVARIPGR